VVDDSATARGWARGVLESAGYEVATAIDGEDGWRSIQESSPELVVCDVDMPRMGGFALTETVRASARFARLPIILFTSRAAEPDRARGSEAGADAFLAKGTDAGPALLGAVAGLI